MHDAGVRGSCVVAGERVGSQEGARNEEGGSVRPVGRAGFGVQGGHALLDPRNMDCEWHRWGKGKPRVGRKAGKKGPLSASIGLGRWEAREGG
jgi:hypothetical protein